MKAEEGGAMIGQKDSRKAVRCLLYAGIFVCDDSGKGPASGSGNNTGDLF